MIILTSCNLLTDYFVFEAKVRVSCYFLLSDQLEKEDSEKNCLNIAVKIFRVKDNTQNYIFAEVIIILY